MLFVVSQQLFRWSYHVFLRLGACIGILLLLLKFFWSFFSFEVPLGYDPGIYLYLFFHYAEAFPPFFFPDLPPWAREHSLGLFLFVSPLVKLGVPVDWFVGWLWNLFPVLLAVVLVCCEIGRAHV